MRMSTQFGLTLRAAPGKTEAEGHQMLVRAGFVRQLGQGIFSYLPLGWRSVRKIENILRQEMDAVGGQELSLPVVHPAEIWKASGRYHTVGPELTRFHDRRGRDMVLAMTHEEGSLLIRVVCGDAGDRQVATFARPRPATAAPLPLEGVATPAAATIDDLAAFLGVPPSQTAKAMFMAAERERPDGTVIVQPI